MLNENYQMTRQEPELCCIKSNCFVNCDATTDQIVTLDETIDVPFLQIFVFSNCQ